jgi:hypothetical protein
VKGHRFIIYGRPGNWRWRYVSPQGVPLARGVRSYKTKPPIYSLLTTLKNFGHRVPVLEEKQ